MLWQGKGAAVPQFIREAVEWIRCYSTNEGSWVQFQGVSGIFPMIHAPIAHSTNSFHHSMLIAPIYDWNTVGAIVNPQFTVTHRLYTYKFICTTKPYLTIISQCSKLVDVLYIDHTWKTPKNLSVLWWKQLDEYFMIQLRVCNIYYNISIVQLDSNVYSTCCIITHISNDTYWHGDQNTIQVNLTVC